MTERKNYTIEEKIVMVKQAIKAKGQKISVVQKAAEFGVSDVALGKWIKQYIKGDLVYDDLQEIQAKNNEDTLMKEMDKELNKPSPEKLDVIICTKSGNGEIALQIDNPGIETTEEQKEAIKELVFDQLKLCVVYDF